MSLPRLTASIALCQGVGIIAGLLTSQSVRTWYMALEKPWFTPPGWVFAPAWLTLYLLMGIALYLVWQKKGVEKRTAVIAFLVQLTLNGFWSLIFFGLHSPFWAFVEISLLWFAIFFTILLFMRISPTASYLLFPYLLWVSFASVLTFSIWRLNPGA
jgi:tryptophan-rich sensory protein